jgi:hypothetical protein
LSSFVYPRRLAFPFNEKPAKIFFPNAFDTPYQAAQKINARYKAGTRTHVFCPSNPDKKEGDW